MIKVPDPDEEKRLSRGRIDRWAKQGWIDLRAKNIKLWQVRFRNFKKVKGQTPEFEGDLAAFIFETEDGGFRKKNHS